LPDALRKKAGWVPLYGEFEVEPNLIRFKGKRIPRNVGTDAPPSEPRDQPTFGLIVSGHTVADGDIEADVVFDGVTQDSVCELAVAYDPNARRIVTAGLGSETWALFGIREFGGPKNQAWWDHQVAGDRSALKSGFTYHLHARFRGAMVTLAIDGVEVATAEVSSPMGRPRQVGLFCRGEHTITVTNFTVNGLKPKAFVVMQFGSEYDAVYKDVVKEVCKDYEVNVLRADEVSGPGLIISDIVREISAAQLVIADITPTNANVYFEVGYALALGKPTILLARKGTALPFDVAGFRVLFYEDTIGGKNRLEEGLRRHLDSILSRSEVPTVPTAADVSRVTR
jgi:hypothetical protein